MCAQCTRTQYFPSFPQLPVATQLEQAVRSLVESEHTISDLKHRTKKAEEHADKMEKALNKAQTELLRRDREMAELRLEISAAQSSHAACMHN